MTRQRPSTPPHSLHPFSLLFALLILSLVACEPEMPFATPQIIVITPVPSPTPAPTATPVVTQTPLPSPTPPISATATIYPCIEDGGQVLHFNDNRSEIADENLRYRVYVPPCYFETQKRYPYVILWHGANNTETQWQDLAVPQVLDDSIGQGTLAPMIVVMPYFGSVGNDNAFPPDTSYETVVLDELIPAIDRDFCTWSDRDHRALGGISRGGFWAFSIGLRHPDLVGILGGHSAFFDPSMSPPDFDPLYLALNDPGLPDAGLRMYLDNGASDLAGGNLQLFSSRLSARGIAHTYIINPVGGHDDDYWAAHVREYLTFYGRDWPKNFDALPSCLEPSP